MYKWSDRNHDIQWEGYRYWNEIELTYKTNDIDDIETKIDIEVKKNKALKKEELIKESKRKSINEL